jgi:hypothetical protein
VAEWQILFDPINVGRSDERRLSQRPAAFGILALKQMTSARAPAHNFAIGGYFETFGHGFPGFNAFGTSHMDLLSLEERAIYSRAQDRWGGRGTRGGKAHRRWTGGQTFHSTHKRGWKK